MILNDLDVPLSCENRGSCSSNILFVHGISVHRPFADIFCAWHSCVPRSVEPRPGIFEAFSTDSWLSEIMSQKCLACHKRCCLQVFDRVCTCVNDLIYCNSLSSHVICLSVCLSVHGLVGL